MKLRAPPSLSGDTRFYAQEMQSLSEWNRQLWDALQGLPTLSKFSGIHPNLSRITGVQGDMLVNVTSRNTNGLAWIMSATGSASTTSGWQAFLYAPIP